MTITLDDIWNTYKDTPTEDRDESFVDGLLEELNNIYPILGNTEQEIKKKALVLKNRLDTRDFMKLITLYNNLTRHKKEYPHLDLNDSYWKNNEKESDENSYGSSFISSNTSNEGLPSDISIDDVSDSKLHDLSTTDDFSDLLSDSVKKKPLREMISGPDMDSQSDSFVNNEEEDINEIDPNETVEGTSESESVEGESQMVPVENQLKIINSMESILKNIQERPLEEVIGDLSSIVPLITDSELSDRMDSYLIDKLSSLKDSRGELLFRDTGEIMNFIQLLRGNKNKRYKLPVKVDKEIRREGIVNMKPSVMISRVQSHVNHLKSQQNRYYW